MKSIFDQEVFSLSREENIWKAKDAQNRVIASAPVVILANAADALRLSPQPDVRLRQVRGQLTLVPAIAGLDHVLLRGGMVLPGIDGVSLVGASYDIDDEDPAAARRQPCRQPAAAGADAAGRLRADWIRRSWTAASRFAPWCATACRWSARWETDLFGAFAYGSRGLLWASLAGEIIASMLEGEPLPVERKLAAAVDPGRFALRARRRKPTSAPA